MLLKVIALSCGLVSSVTVTEVPLVAATPKVAVSLAAWPVDARRIATRPVAAYRPIAAGPVGPCAVNGPGRYGNAIRSIQPRDQEAFTVAPDVVYSPIVPCSIRDKQVRSGHGKAKRVIQPRDQRGVHDCSRRGVFANRAVAVQPFATNRFDPDTARPTGSLNPETSEAFTVPPDVVYSPIVSLP